MFYIILTDIRRQTYIIWFIIPSLLLLLIIETSMFIYGISVRSVSKSVCLPVIDSILCFLFNCFVFLSNLFLGRTGFFLTKEIRSFWINFLKLSLRCWGVCFTNTTSVSSFLACCKDASVFYQNIQFHPLLLTSRFCLVQFSFRKKLY